MSESDWHSIIFDSTIPFADRTQLVLDYQLQKNEIYHDFAAVFGVEKHAKYTSGEIPLLPIRAFRLGELFTSHSKPELEFKSSGTSDMLRSTHFVADPILYQKASATEFCRHFPLEKYAVLFCLPGYAENRYSSLIWMADYLMSLDESGLSGYYKNKIEADIWIEHVHKAAKKPLLFGAAFGLLDLIDDGTAFNIKDLDIIETGGMKTHRREVSKSELRIKLCKGFEIEDQHIHSEYGMCELLSQMYAIGSEWFTSPHWVNVTVRKADNPDEICAPGEEGIIGIIDLANVYSCPFILTEDKGVMNKKGEFKVLGRWNADDLRGCNFLIDRD